MGPIPNNAKKVFEGILFDIYQWDQELFDGSKATFEFARRADSTQLLVITKNKKIVLVREEQPAKRKFTTIPGGRVERNETPKENAKKELIEETGMKAREIKLWRKTYTGGKIEWYHYYYIMKGCEKVQEINPDAGEKIEPYEVTFEEFLEEVEKPEFRNKAFADIIFRIKHTPGELKKFKELLFN